MVTLVQNNFPLSYYAETYVSQSRSPAEALPCALSSQVHCPQIAFVGNHRIRKGCILYCQIQGKRLETKQRRR